MSSSYYSTRGMNQDAPIVGSNEENYASEEVDLVKEVNQNIDETTNLNNEYFASLKAAYEHMDGQDQKRIPEVIRWARGEGTKVAGELNEFNKYLGEIDEYEKNLLDFKQAKLKPNVAAFPHLTENEQIANATGDKKLITEERVHNNRNVVKTQANSLITELQSSDLQAAVEIDQPYMVDSLRSKDLVDVKNKMPSWRTYSDAAVKVHDASFGYTDEGEPIYYTYNDAPYEFKGLIRRITDGWYLKQHEHVARGRLGLYKRDVIKWAIEDRRTQDKELLKDSTQAFKEDYQIRIAEDLQNRLQLEGGQAFVEMIQTETPRFVDPITGLPSSRLSREAHTNNFIKGVELEVLGRTELNKILETWVQPYYKEGHEPPPKRQFKDQWPKESRRMIAAVAKADEARLQAHQDDLKGKKAADTSAIIEWAQQEIRSYEDVQQKVAEFKSEYAITNDEQLPNELKNLMYQGRGRDVELDAKFEFTLDYGDGTAPDINEVRQLTSEALQKKWKNIIEQKIGLSKEGKGPGSVHQREQTINILSNQHALETDTQVSKTSKWDNIKTNARVAYNDAWRAAKEEGLSDWAAHKAAKKAVQDGLKVKVPILNSKGEPTGRERTAWEVLNGGDEINQLLDQKKAIKAILANKDLINQPEPFRGEEPHLKAGIKYLQKKGPFPAYYHAIAQKTGYVGGGKALLRDRLVANGHLKDGQLVFPDEKNVDSTDLRTLTVNPTPSKTYGLVQGAEDYTWMLKSTQNDDSKENGGYLALKDQNGKWTNIEAVTGKKLDQITYRDVHSLALNGYSHFGMYGLRPQGIVDLVNSGQVPLDGTWDVKDQDLLLLARLRQKTQQAQYNTGIKSRYRRLVNIRKEDHERFKTIAGDLPTYNQLDNLLVECAQEQCNVLLQQ